MRDEINVYEVFNLDGFSTNLHKAEFMQFVNDQYGHDIENQRLVKLFIDSHFDETSNQIFKIAMVYTLFYVAPFVSQIFIEDHNIVRGLCLCCLCCHAFFISIEVIQVRQKGLDSYKEDLWNIIDLSQFVFYIVYIIFRFQNLDSILPNDQN